MGTVETIEAALAAAGWSREGGSWTRVLGERELGDLSRYVGERPLAEIASGRAAGVFGTGAAGIAAFAAEAYVSAAAEDPAAWLSGALGAEAGDGFDEEEAAEWMESWLEPEVDEAFAGEWARARLGGAGL